MDRPSGPAKRRDISEKQGSSVNREDLEMNILRGVAESIGSFPDTGKIFEDTMDILARELHMKRGTLVLHDRVTGELKIVAAHGLSDEEKSRGRYRIGEGITGRVVETGEPVSVRDISANNSFLNRTGARKDESRQAPVAFVCVPIKAEKEVVGAISIDRIFSDDQTLDKDRRLLQIISTLLGQAIKINRMVILEREQLLEENQRLKKDLHSKYRFGNIVAASGLMQDVIDTAATVAKSKATVLIRGETGTGKELIAGLIHYNSERDEGPFIKVNCSALSENLLESELFGHEKGAFTGALQQRKGRFELADGGTIFLDEIGTISGRMQVKLLRVLQEREFERVGGSETLKSDIRIVAATNSDLENEMREGRFREDLYYRLNVIPIFIPPLRERREDIPFLVDFFLEKYNREYGKNVSSLSREVVDILLAFQWPGNVRELESCIERAVVLSRRGTITPDLLPVSLRSFDSRSPEGDEGVTRPVSELDSGAYYLDNMLGDAGHGSVYEQVMAEVEKKLFEAVLKKHGYVQTKAAEELGVSRNTVRKKIKDLGIER